MKSMNEFEYQLFIQIKDKVWAKAMSNNVQNWTLRNCRDIKTRIEAVVGVSIHEKSIERFAKLSQSQKISSNTTKYVLAMYLKDERSTTGNYNTKAWDEMLQDTQNTIPLTQNTIASIRGFSGVYQICYQSKMLGEIQDDAKLHIDMQGNSRLELQMAHGVKEWKGVAQLKNQYLFIVLENDAEMLYLIVKVFTDNDYWIGMLLAVDDVLGAPNSTIFLAMKEPLKEAEKKERIALFFKQKSSYRLTIDKNLQEIVVNSSLKLEKLKQFLNKDIASILGNWIIYSAGDDKETIFQSRMMVNGLNDVLYEGLRMNYTGSLVIKNQDVYIYLYGEKNAFLSFSLSYLKIELINHIVATYATIGSECSCPVFGSVVLVRSNLNFENIAIKEIFQEDEQYNTLKQGGILEKLTYRRFENDRKFN
jgi:hypothetical protein